MPAITFIEPSGHARTIDVAEGWTLMQGATANGVDGIEGECGGSCACATCHVYIAPEWAAKLPAPEDTENAMLECVASERRPTSRLCCQIKIGPELQGLVVAIPETQV